MICRCRRNLPGGEPGPGYLTDIQVGQLGQTLCLTRAFKVSKMMHDASCKALAHEDIQFRGQER